MRRRRGKRRGGEGERERRGKEEEEIQQEEEEEEEEDKEGGKGEAGEGGSYFLNDVDMYKQWGEIKSSDMFTFLNLVIFSVIPGLWPLVVFLYCYNQFPFFD